MTYTTYSHQQLQHKSIARLKQIYSDIICTVEVVDKRCKDAWINAIADYQASQVQTAVNAAPDEQALAQAELNQYIADQAETIAPQLTTVEINCYHYEVYALKQLVAYITYDYDEFVTQPWVVMVNGEEKFRHQTQAQCYRYIQWHHQDGTLNSQIETEVPEVPTILEISFYDQEAFFGDQLVARFLYRRRGFRPSSQGKDEQLALPPVTTEQLKQRQRAEFEQLVGESSDQEKEKLEAAKQEALKQLWSKGDDDDTDVPF